MLEPAKILIGTPTADQMVSIRYMSAVRQLEKRLWLERPGIQLRSQFIQGAVVAFARNIMATRVLNDRSFSHLLFVDADIGFRPEAIMKLLDYDVDICGCICPARRDNNERQHRIHRTVADVRLATRIAQDYVGSESIVRPYARPSTDRASGFIQTATIGMGCTLIKRNVFETMAARFPELLSTKQDPYLAFGVEGPALQCFESIKEPSTGLFLSEDLSFANRWTSRCAGKIWACVDEVIVHVGTKEYQGRFSDRLSYEQSEVTARARQSS